MNLKKYSNFENWIPAVDVDEIDTNKNYVRDIINGDFHNGFISNAVAPTEVALPTAIQSLITSGYELLCYKYFKHSVQGDVYISVLYKLIAGVHTLKFYVNSTLLNIDEQNNDLVVTAKPTIISYDLIEDQFKINLNVNGTTATLSKTVILNLTFVYLSARVYLTTTRQRSAGWYVFPRWLGWTLEETDTEINYDTDSTAIFLENCNDNTFLSHFNLGSVFTWSAGGGLPSFASMAGSIGFYNTSVSDGKWGWINVDTLRHLKTIKFKWGTGYLINGYTHLKVGITNSSVITNPDSDASWIEIWNNLYSSAQDHLLQEFDQEVNMVVEKDDKITTTSFKLWIGVGLPAQDSASSPYVNMRDIELIALKGCFLSKNEDKQRAQIKDEFDVGLFDYPKLYIPVTNVDWRIINYELYLSFNDIYSLYKEIEVKNGNWTESAGDLIGVPVIATDFPDVITTLNFNYGLGATVRVDEQKLIYREASYRNRTYFTKADNKLYYSHISGTGLAQPDSFPYSEEEQFGYLIVDNDIICKAVCVSSLDEVVIITEKNNHVYTIESVSGVPFRRIKAINGGKGILSVNSLCTDFNGTPISSILLWSDKWANYGYAGGRDIPVSLTGVTHKNYWKTVAGKDTAITIYNKASDEFWIQLDSLIMIYELTTNTWKKYELTYNIKDYVGIIDNYTYFLGDDNKVYKIDPAGVTLLQCTVEFHDDIMQPDNSVESYDSEVQMKILQDIYVSFKDAELVQNIYATLYVYIEDYLVDTITIPVNYKNYIARTALGVGFGRMRCKLVLPITSTAAKLKELGVWSTLSGIMNVSVESVQEGVGQSEGQEIGIFG